MSKTIADTTDWQRAMTLAGVDIGIMPIEANPFVDQLMDAIAARMQQLSQVGNFGDSGLLWQCHKAIQAFRLECGRLRVLVPPENKAEERR